MLGGETSVLCRPLQLPLSLSRPTRSSGEHVDVAAVVRSGQGLMRVPGVEGLLRDQRRGEQGVTPFELFST